MKKTIGLWILALGIGITSPTGILAQPQMKSLFEHVHALAMDPEGQTLLLGAHTGLFQSDDGGSTWHQSPLPKEFPHLDVMAIGVNVKDAPTMYVATHEAGILKSTNAGMTWKQANNGLGGMDVHGLAVDTGSPEKLYAAIREKGEGVYRTRDGGARWVRIDDGPVGEVKVLTSVNVPTGMGGIFLYAGTSTGLQRSPDCF